MIHRRKYIARHQASLQDCVRRVVGQSRPGNIKNVQTYVYDHLPPFHFQVHAEVAPELYRRVYVEYDERLTTLQRDRIDFKIAFVREGRLLGDTQWQHHSFSTKDQLPEAAAVILAGHIREWFSALVVPDHAELDKALRQDQ